MANTEKETIVHKTEFVERELPSINISKVDVKTQTNFNKIDIKVSDRTSREAFETLVKVKKEFKI